MPVMSQEAPSFIGRLLQHKAIAWVLLVVFRGAACGLGCWLGVQILNP